MTVYIPVGKKRDLLQASACHRVYNVHLNIQRTHDNNLYCNMYGELLMDKIERSLCSIVLQTYTVLDWGKREIVVKMQINLNDASPTSTMYCLCMS